MRTKFTLLGLILTISISSFSQKLGDYMEIGGVQAFVFYLDETGQHGLAMSMPALSPKQLKGIDKYVKKSLMTETQAEFLRNGNVSLDLDAYKKAGKLKKEAWCQGENYDAADTPTIYQRSTAICKMHKARVRANNYYWNKLYRKLELEGEREEFEKNKKSLKDVIC